MIIRHNRTQYPIGQGGFHSGQVHIDDSTFTYVYDCGSTKQNPLIEEVRYFSENTDKVDALFLSHLDNDHVSGVDCLIQNCPVEYAFLPYLCPYTRLLIIAEEHDQSTFSPQLQLLCDPREWFNQRGVEPIFVNNDSDESLPEDATPDKPRDKDKDKDKINSQPFTLNIEAQNADGYQVMDCKKSIRVSRNVQLAWEFLCYVHPRTDKIKNFKAEIKKAFPGLISKEKIRFSKIQRILQVKSERKKLKSLYTRLGRDHNQQSLCLYSNVDRSFTTSEVIGWLATGDAKLKEKIRCDEFYNHYSKHSTHIKTLVLPHHGSIRNFNRDLLQIGNIHVTTGRNSRHHPSPEVVHQVREADKDHINVNDNLFYEHFEIDTEKVKNQLGDRPLRRIEI